MRSAGVGLKRVHTIMVTHVVMFEFTAFEAAVPAQRLLESMRGQIPELAEIEVGVDRCRSERALDLVLITRFQSWADMEVYRKHPRHVEVLAGLEELGLKRSLVVDY